MLYIYSQSPFSLSLYVLYFTYVLQSTLLNLKSLAFWKQMHWWQISSLTNWNILGGRKCQRIAILHWFIKTFFLWYIFHKKNSLLPYSVPPYACGYYRGGVAGEWNTCLHIQQHSHEMRPFKTNSGRSASPLIIKGVKNMAEVILHQVPVFVQ